MIRLLLMIAMTTAMSGSANAKDVAKCASGSADVVKVDYWSPFLSAVMLDYVNATDRAIQLIHASAVVTDALGAVVGKVELPADERLEAGAKRSVVVPIDPARKISEATMDNFAAFVCTNAVLYQDGDKQSF